MRPNLLYHPDSRGIEYDLLPWCRRHRMPVMAYSPIGEGGRRLRSKALADVAKHHGATPAQVAIAWRLRHKDVISIPKAVDAGRLRDNARGTEIALSAEDVATIDAVHPLPSRKLPLDIL